MGRDAASDVAELRLSYRVESKGGPSCTGAIGLARVVTNAFDLDVDARVASSPGETYHVRFAATRRGS